MITIKDFLETVEYKITEGDNYLWTCYGPNVRSLDYWNGSQTNSVSININFDTVDQTVYEMQAWDGSNDREYRWINPDFIKAHKKEAKKRGTKFKQSIDERNFIEIDLEQDILQKAKAIFNEEDYDTRIMVELTLDDDEMFQLMTMAHEADMTLNQMVEKILRDVIDRLEK
jgi:hypothetical protein